MELAGRAWGTGPRAGPWPLFLEAVTPANQVSTWITGPTTPLSDKAIMA